MRIDEFIQVVPKAELNVHIEGCLKPELILRLKEENRLTLPYDTLADLQSAFNITNRNNLFTLYQNVIKVLQKPEDFYALMSLYLQEAHEQTIKHAEISFDPVAHMQRGIAFATIIESFNSAMKAAKEKFGISSTLIMNVRREQSSISPSDLLKEACSFKDAITAIGLTSQGDLQLEDFQDVFKKAEAEGFLTIASVGEVGAVNEIIEAIETLKVSRIHHGIAAIEDPDVLSRLAAHQTPLVICPVANIRLGIFQNMKHHPLKKLYEDGVVVTIGSDAPGYFNAGLNENYQAACSALKLNKHIIHEIALNSFGASFLDYAVRDRFINELEQVYKRAQTLQA